MFLLIKMTFSNLQISITKLLYQFSFFVRLWTLIDASWMQLYEVQEMKFYAEAESREKLIKMLLV